MEFGELMEDVVEVTTPIGSSLPEGLAVINFGHIHRHAKLVV